MTKAQLIKEYEDFLSEAEAYRELLRKSANAVLDITQNHDAIRDFRKRLTGRLAKLSKSLRKLSRNPRFQDPFHGVVYGAYDNAFSADILQRSGRSLDAVIEDLTYIVATLQNMTPAEYKELFPSPKPSAKDKDQPTAPFDFWQLVHPKIREVSETRYTAGHYADAVEAAYKEINSIVKKIHKKKTSTELDGNALMKAAMSLQNPSIIIEDLDSDTGKSMQQGYMEIFAGSMTGIRNPKAHANLQITDIEAQRFLIMASILMYRLDNAIIT